jgi:hypothetical protein
VDVYRKKRKYIFTAGWFRVGNSAPTESPQCPAVPTRAVSAETTDAEQRSRTVCLSPRNLAFAFPWLTAQRKLPPTKARIFRAGHALRHQRKAEGVHASCNPVPGTTSLPQRNLLRREQDSSATRLRPSVPGEPSEVFRQRRARFVGVGTAYRAHQELSKNTDRTSVFVIRNLSVKFFRLSTRITSRLCSKMNTN